ncbi:tetratricopeptide repeat protein [Porphyromonas pogonae]|uniref:tetratricopeptide repeat protein n=1 Tax=Porphyromonas pogonae TaxID=867595 RepID=UPI002E79EF41|nr:tetratricopeptide repeat protein [Porphyromonas pogonae]
MKLKNLFLGAALALMTSSVFAQTGVQTGTPFGSGQDSIRCRQNTSLFSSNAKNENYADAYKYWLEVYKECPGSTKNVYFYGAKILNWRLEQEKDAGKRKALLDSLMGLYDNRVKYFGDDPKYDKDWITSSKVGDYIRIMGENADYNKVYTWLKPIVDEKKDHTSAATLSYYTYASLMRAIADSTQHSQYIKDYNLAAKSMETQINACTDSTEKSQLEALKTPMDELFARSGLADCDMLQKMYADELEAHKSDAKYLKTMLALFQMSECDAPIYFQASKYLFALEPSAEAAIGLAREAMNGKRYTEAMDYLQKAVGLSKEAKQRANVYYTMGVISMNQRSYGAARAHFQKALAENPNMGMAYVNIALMYASSADSIFPGDPVKQRCVYYLVIDKLNKARSVDPSVAPKASGLIAKYSRYLPSASDVFMHPDLSKGKTLTIGGWIGESTVIR